MSLIALAQAACVAVETPCCVELPESKPLCGSIDETSATSSVPVVLSSDDGSASSTCPSTLEWSAKMTAEERQFITKKIKHAYQRKTPTYEELLDTCCAIEEEFIFMVAPSRLDYFKSGVQYEKRIVGKLTNLRRTAAATKSDESNSVEESARIVKRMKTQH